MEILQPIGKYVHLVDERNTDLAITNLLGVAKEKYFMPSVANVVGTDLSRYKVIRKGRFACNLMHVSRDEVLPVALYIDDTPSIISPAYPMFEVNDEKELLPEYLSMYLMRSEFDREVAFYSMNGVRGGLEWEDFMNMQVPVPPIEDQRRIVAEYQAIEQCIANNKLLIDNVKGIGLIIYKDFLIKHTESDKLPSNWYWCSIKDFCKKITSGGTPLRTEPSYWDKKDYRWLKTGEIKNNVIVDTEEYISEKGLSNSSAKLIPKGAISFAMYCADGITGGQVAYLDCDTTTNQACCNMICHCKEDAAYLFFYFLNQQRELKRIANGAAQANLSQSIISEQKILRYSNRTIEATFTYLLNYLILLYRENRLYEQCKTFLLSKLT